MSNFAERPILSPLASGSLLPVEATAHPIQSTAGLLGTPDYWIRITVVGGAAVLVPAWVESPRA